MRSALQLLVLLSLFSVFPSAMRGQETHPADVIPTATGDLTLTFVGHGTLMFQYQGKVIHVDPVSREADYTAMPDGDLILVTHEHGDHLDAEAVREVAGPDTEIVVSPSCDGRLDGATVLENGESMVAAGLTIEAVPAYNLVHMCPRGSRIIRRETATATSSTSETPGCTWRGTRRIPRR